LELIHKTLEIRRHAWLEKPVILYPCSYPDETRQLFFKINAEEMMVSYEFYFSPITVIRSKDPENKSLLHLTRQETGTKYFGFFF
jgi:hypothetical protein